MKAYADQLGADIRSGQRVVKVSAGGSAGLTTVTEEGLELDSTYVIAATGGFGSPRIPELSGMEGFTGEVLHSSEYRAPDAYEGKRVVVVGAGNSAVQIAAELAKTTRVTLASRAPVRWIDQRPFGTRENVDALILATGYRPDLPYLEGTDALDATGVPLHQAGVSTTVRGLGFVGLEYQHNNASASLRGVGRDATYVLRKLTRR